MSTTLNTSLVMSGTVGGTTKTVQMIDTITLTGRPCAIAGPVNVPEDHNGGTATTLWQHTNHNASGLTPAFTLAVIQVDPGKLLTTAPVLDVEVSVTKVSDGTVTVYAFRISRACPMILGSGYSGANVANAILTSALMTGQVVSKIRVANPAAAGSPANSNDAEAMMTMFT
jgi:hypothetical protein